MSRWVGVTLTYSAEKASSTCSFLHAEKTGRKKNACIALAKSNNLRQWKVIGDLLFPQQFRQMEVPQLVAVKDRYYLFFSVGDRGCHCYTSDSFFGKFKPVNKSGKILNSNGLYAIHIVEKTPDHPIALGFMSGTGSQFVGRITDPVKLKLSKDAVKVVHSADQ